MSQRFASICCGTAIVAVLGLPVSGQAQTLADSVSRWSDAEVHQKPNRSTSNQGQWALGKRERMRRGAVRGALIGGIAGFIAGLKINSSCHDEGGGCRGVVIGLPVAGAAIGAAIGAGRAAAP